MAQNACLSSILGLPGLPTRFGGKSNSTSSQNLSLTRKRQLMANCKLHIKITGKNQNKNDSTKNNQK
jgi:hypothetical protein